KWTAREARGAQARDGRLVVVRVDHVDPPTPHARDQAREEDRVERETGWVRPRAIGEPRSVRDELDRVAAAPEPVGHVAAQHPRSAKRRKRPRDDERYAHQLAAST